MIGLFRFKPGAYSNSKVTARYIRLVLAGGTRRAGRSSPTRARRRRRHAAGPGHRRRPADRQLPAGADARVQRDRRRARRPDHRAAALRVHPVQRADLADRPADGRRPCPRRRSASRPTASSAVSCRPSRRSGTSRTSTSARRSRTARSPGLTSPVTGTYNADTKAYTLEWTSQIVGGAFNNFSAAWHFEGTFEPGCAAEPRRRRKGPKLDQHICSICVRQASGRIDLRCAKRAAN